MTSEQLSRKVADLEQYLTEVWDVRNLFHIASVLYGLDGDTELSDEQHRATFRRYSGDLDDHLFAAYRNATQRATEVLSEVVEHDGVEVLLERLSHRVRGLVPLEPFQWSWGNLPQVRLDDYLPAGFLAQNDLLTLQGIDIEQDPDGAFLKIADAVWSHVHRDVAHYIGKVAAYIDQYRTDIGERTASEPVVNLERIRWNDTAALLGQLVHELADKGYITPPQRAGAHNWTAAARTLYAAFDIRKPNGDPVKFSSLDAALKPEGDRDIKGARAAFKIYPRQ
jgi:hypothetical protein